MSDNLEDLSGVRRDFKCSLIYLFKLCDTNVIIVRAFHVKSHSVFT